MSKYVNAKAGQRNSVIYTDTGGAEFSFEGGNRPWRNQNPGNVKQGKISKSNGSIGTAGGFAVFPDYQSGHNALIETLRITYANKDIPELMKGYAPPFENDTPAYVRFIRKQTGVSGNKKIKDFSVSEFEKLWRAIELMEGWGKSVGKIRSLAKKATVMDVSYDNFGVIERYEILGYGWVSKDEGIALTQQGKVDAIVATSSHGHLFLRGRPRHAIS